ncbi:MAG: hypothetical protein IJX72_05650 [Clostridia bacterium]|nr:hypothetical protein [Clostridia bacterium]
MKKMYRWIPIGGLSLIGLVASVIIMQYNRKLTVSIAILCGLTLLVAAIKIARNKWLVVDAKALWDGEAIRSTVAPTVAFVAVTLALSFLLELILSFLYFVSSIPVLPEYEGVEYYKNQEYADFRWGKEASRHLPAYEELEGATHIEFFYDDQFLMETVYIHTSTTFTLQVSYSAERYAVLKQEVCRDGEYFGTPWDPNDWLLKKEKLPFGNYLYYIVTCSDEDQTLTYQVKILDSYDHTSRTTFPGIGA